MVPASDQQREERGGGWGVGGGGLEGKHYYTARGVVKASVESL